MSSADFSPYRFVAGAIVVLAAISVIVILVNANGMLGNPARDKELEEACRQYSESNTAAFYSKLESLNRISVQLASTTLTPEMRSELISQRDDIESKMRQDVAKIPVGSRTAAMFPYSN